MSYSLSVWLDPQTSRALEILCKQHERKRSDMVKVLIRKAVKEIPSNERDSFMAGSTKANIKK